MKPPLCDTFPSLCARFSNPLPPPRFCFHVTFYAFFPYPFALFLALLFPVFFATCHATYTQFATSQALCNPAIMTLFFFGHTNPFSRKAREEREEYNNYLNSLSGDTLLWGCNKSDDIFYARVKLGEDLGKPNWTQVPGKGRQIDCSKDWVYLLNKNQQIYRKPSDNSADWKE